MDLIFMNMSKYQKSTLGGPMREQFVLQSYFLMYYLGILTFLMKVLPHENISPLRKKIALILERTVKSTHLAA